MRDLLLYVGIAIVLYASIVVFAFHQAKTDQPPGLPMKWLGFAAMTAFVIGDAIRSSPRWRRRPRFWFLLCVFFVAQCGFGIAVLSAITEFSTMVWAFLIPL